LPKQIELSTMNLDELKQKLTINNVPERWYSLDDGLKPDACILYKNYSKWEFFYLDEKGNRNNYQVFVTDDEAFDHLWKMMEGQLGLLKNMGKR